MANVCLLSFSPDQLAVSAPKSCGGRLDSDSRTGLGSPPQEGGGVASVAFVCMGIWAVAKILAG